MLGALSPNDEDFSSPILKQLSYVADVLLTQTGTGNFCAWYYSQRRQLMARDEEASKLLKIENSIELSVELGGSIDYIIDVKTIENNAQSDSHKKVQFVEKREFDSPTQSVPTINQTLYKPPNIDMNGSEIAIKLPNSFTDSGFATTASPHQIFVPSADHHQPDDIHQHIINEYGNTDILYDD